MENRVDEYINNLKVWKEEMVLLRSILLSCDLTETIKWGSPCYMWKNENIAGLTAFKNYTGLWFFQGGLLQDKNKYLMNAQEGKTKAMRQWRFFSREEILSAPIRDYILESVENYKLGIKIKPSSKNKVFEIPELLTKALIDDHQLNLAWNLFSPSCQREYAEYLAEAKLEETRKKRLDKMIVMIKNNMSLNDKYKK